MQESWPTLPCIVVSRLVACKIALVLDVLAEKQTPQQLFDSRGAVVGQVFIICNNRGMP